MHVVTTVTQKGQVTIPKAFREKVGIGAYQKVRVEVQEKFVKITPQSTLLQIAPLAKAAKGRDALKARAMMEKKYNRV